MSAYWPHWRDWLFGAKTFFSAMLALFIALSFDLPSPYWAVAAVYIVANPLAGATSSKGLFRVMGTLIGASAAVLFMPLFVDTPILFSLVVAVWTGCLLFISMLDRTSRSYVFMLAGYTLALVALPTVGNPESIFDVALARFEEIEIGITCASVIGAIVFPTSVGSVLSARIQTWLGDAADWAESILRGDGASLTTPLSRQRLAADVANLDLIISQLGYDAATRDLAGAARELRGRLLMLLPTLSSVANRLHALARRPQGIPADIRSLLDNVAAWMRRDAEPEEAELFRARLEELEPTAARQGWDDLIVTGTLERLRELIDLWEDCLSLQRRIAAREPAAVADHPLRYRRAANGARHHDHGLMAFNAVMVVLTVFAACLIWIYSGWDNGGVFAMMAAVAASLFAQSDTPAKLIVGMWVWTVASLPIAAGYVFGLMPLVHSFEMLVLIFAPLFLIFGALTNRRAIGTASNLIMLHVALFVPLQNRYSGDFATFTNSALANLAGITFALACSMITRPFGAELAAHRLVHAGWRDLAKLAEGRHRQDHATLSARMLDRLGRLVPRLAGLDNARLSQVDGLAELRIGFNILALQEQRAQLPTAAATTVDVTLHDVARHYRAHRPHHAPPPPSPDLLTHIDHALQANLGDHPAGRIAINALVGLRRAFFPDAAPPDLHTADSHSPTLRHAC
ncbi:FUSC family protein [Actomonas aquatica]|uniref:FUSC family protein n=1 Tax=Actomonas aquatica TaxID=2866162 RepID=A0ABZ1C4H5_9BACT|nr:FUSC family protein [Opitutus sp. WL0086]WRQ86621.1 FUSC family protein [Opitutus sp. WL0086]